MKDKKRSSKISNPIHIGHHTVCGHEAVNLAKRLSQELATQNQTAHVGSLPRAISPEEPISRSFEGKKGKLFLSVKIIVFSIFSMLTLLTTLCS